MPTVVYVLSFHFPKKSTAIGLIAYTLYSHCHPAWHPYKGDRRECRLCTISVSGDARLKDGNALHCTGRTASTSSPKAWPDSAECSSICALHCSIWWQSAQEQRSGVASPNCFPIVSRLATGPTFSDPLSTPSPKTPTSNCRHPGKTPARLPHTWQGTKQLWRWLSPPCAVL